MTILNIIETIDRWGMKEPNRPVYIENNRTYTYGELKEDSDAIAAYLQKNIERSRPVVVYGELEYEMVACFLGASKAGHAYIPIEAHTPKERVEMILDVADPAVIFSVREWPKVETNAEIISLEQLHTIYAKTWTLESALKPVLETETYYIIFTSRHNRCPKGVQISHMNLLSFVNWELTDFGITEGMRFLSQAPYSFDLSVMDLYPALTSGGSLTPMGKEIINDFKQLFTVLPTLEIEVWVSTPSFVDICLMEPTFDGGHVDSLKLFLFCGEELPKATAQKLLERFPKAHIFNTYGPTEATVAISSVKITQELLNEYNRVPIGHVKEDTTVYIMDGKKEVSAGEVGEIVIAGPSVSKGYLHNRKKRQMLFLSIKVNQRIVRVMLENYKKVC